MRMQPHPSTVRRPARKTSASTNRSDHARSQLTMEVVGKNGVPLPNATASNSTASNSSGEGSAPHMTAGELGNGANGGIPPVVVATQACVKVFCTSVAPCYTLPWLRGAESHAYGSGFAVQLASGEQRLLTSAQVVENHTLVQVRRAAEAQKYVARVECYGFDVDIAVLQVDDPQFWEGLPVLSLGTVGLPNTMTEVLAAGFPQGGDELSTTRANVNRVTLGGAIRELCLQVDASISPGTWGGPVLSLDGKLVGMASVNQQQPQDRGYIISLPVLNTFLTNVGIGIGNGTVKPYNGKSTDCFRVQALENPELRIQLGLPARPGIGDDGGVLVTKLPADSPSNGVLQEGDVLLALDGIPIAADGTVLLPNAPNGVRIGMRYLVQRAALDSHLTYRVLRAGERRDMTVVAAPRIRHLMPPRQPVPQPQWVVLGGLVFTPLLPDYEMLVPKCQLARVHEPPSFDGEQVVLLLRVLQAEVNIGYEDVCGMLETFNGEKINSLGHLREKTNEAQATELEQLEFRLVTGELLVLDAAQCWEQENDIFSVHTIPCRASSDLPNRALG